MFSRKSLLKALAALATITLIASCSDSEAVKAEAQGSGPQPIILDIFKSPTCGCCKKWIDHIDENGFQSKVHNRKNIFVIKKDKGIEPRYRSCHTAISKNGYVFEGHIPAKFIQQFLNEKHPDNVIGLSVPGMPLGSPGMEVGDKFQPYKVIILKSDGSYEIYADITSSQEQF
jgi:hypothetical protein